MQATSSHAETQPEQPRTRSGPIVIAYDGSQAAENALREAGALLAGSSALLLGGLEGRPGVRAHGASDGDDRVAADDDRRPHGTGHRPADVRERAAHRRARRAA